MHRLALAFESKAARSWTKEIDVEGQQAVRQRPQVIDHDATDVLTRDNARVAQRVSQLGPTIPCLHHLGLVAHWWMAGAVRMLRQQFVVKWAIIICMRPRWQLMAKPSSQGSVEGRVSKAFRARLFRIRPPAHG